MKCHITLQAVSSQQAYGNTGQALDIQLSSDMQEEYVSLLTVFENLEALYICRNVITVYPNCKSMIDVAKQKLMNDPTFKHLSEDCQAYYFDFEAYASHLQEHGKFLVTEHGIFELPE